MRTVSAGGTTFAAAPTLPAGTTPTAYAASTGTTGTAVASAALYAHYFGLLRRAHHQQESVR